MKLKNSKYYIGKTMNFDRRLQAHLSGNGALWTKRYDILSVIEKYRVKQIYSSCKETQLTCEYVKIWI